MKFVNLYYLLLLATLVAMAFSSSATAQETTAALPKLPKPDIADGKYGSFAANTFDLWKAKSTKPTPLVVYIHGGGLARGDKSALSPNLLNEMLEAGLSVMAINYRLTGEAIFPQHYMDCARAIQYARHHAKDLNIDPKRIAATGSSAGGMTALWIGFHDDLADKKNPDPILREFTRLRVLAISAAQTTLSPDAVSKYVGPLALQYQTYFNGRVFGKTTEEMKTASGLKLYEAISPLTYLTKDDPPVWAFYSVSAKPLTAESTTSDAIHHPGFGVVLKESMDKFKIECKLRHRDDGQKVNDDMVRFIQKYI